MHREQKAPVYVLHLGSNPRAGLKQDPLSKI